MAGKLSSLFGAQDMTQGSPMKNLVRFSVPLLIGNLAQQLYSTVDSIVVGNYEGKGALAALGACGPVLNLLLVLFMGISMGASVMASQYYGAKDREKLSFTIGTTLTATFLTALLIMIVGPLVSRPMMEMLGTPNTLAEGAPEGSLTVLEMASTYMTIWCLGFLGCAYFNVISGLLRGLGDSVMPVIFLLVSCGLNIVLDIWFVAGFKWGVAGVAWATILAQFISSILCIYRLLHMKDVFHVKPKMLLPRKRYVYQLVRLGLPSGLTQAIFSFAMVILQSLTNSYGEDILAANTAVMRVDGFAMMPNFTFGTALTTFAGQNLGAGRLDRAEKGTKEGMKLGLGVSIVLVALILIFGPYLMEVFVPNDTKVVDLGVTMLQTLAVGYVAMAVTQVLSGTMRGAGDTMTPMWISLITTVIIRVPVAYAMEFFSRPAGGEMGSGDPFPIFVSLLISWVIGAVLTIFFYARGKWKKKSIVATPGASGGEAVAGLELEADAPGEELED